MIYMNDNVEFAVTFSAPRPLSDVTFGLVVKNEFQMPLFGVNNLFQHSQPLQQQVKRGRVVCRLEKLPLVPGTYYVDLYLGTHGRNFDVVLDAARFEVH